MESDSLIACASCGSPLGIGECSAGDDVACGSCGAVHRIECLPDDDVTDEIVRPDESDWDPDEDAARIFGESRDEATSEPTAEKVAGKMAENAPAGCRSRGGLGRPVTVALILALGAAGTWEWYQLQLRERALLSRVTFLEERLVATSRKMSRSGDTSTSLVSLQARVAELDDSLSRMATHFRMHSANTLQMDQSLQGARDVLVRQERQMGKLGLKMVLLEREMADKSRHAREAFELAQNKRQAADQAAVPMRKRLVSLESKHETLLAKYRALSMPRRPQNVLSTRRAAEIMREWETQIAPTLDHLQAEITGVGNRIRRERFAIDELYSDIDAGLEE